MEWSEMRKTGEALQQAISEAIASNPTHEQLVAIVAALSGTMGTMTLHMNSMSEYIELLDARVKKLEAQANGGQ